MPDPRLLGLLGAFGTALFAVVVAGLTAINWSFLRDRGWDLVSSSDVPFPSTLALGPAGWLQVINFGVLGLATLAIAAGLWQALEPRPTLALVLLIVAGLAALGLMAPTDGSLSSVRSLSGAVHVGAFFALLVSIVLASLLLGVAAGSIAGWADIGGLSIVAAIGVVLLTAVSFVVPAIGGLASVLSIGAMLVWLEVVAVRLATGS